jgi:AcrR family transcriptional regulator
LRLLGTTLKSRPGYLRRVTIGSEPRRADARRSIDAILVAARDVFAEDSNAELGAVAARAGVHRVTLYRHFSSREALVSALHNASIDDANAAVRQVDLEADDLLAEVAGLLRRLYEVNLRWRSYGWAPGYSAGTPERERRRELGAITQSLFLAAQQQGLLRQDLDQRELLYTWGAPMIYLAGTIAEGNWTLDEVLDYTMRLLTPS